VRRHNVAGEQRLRWDDLGRLVEVENPEGTVYRYRYDAFSRLVERLVDPIQGAVRRWSFLWSGDRLAGEDRPDGTRVRYVTLERGDLLPWAAWVERPGQPGELYLLHRDVRGAVVAATDPEGRFAWWAEYEPYGACQARDEGLDLRLRLPGQWSDPGTGLYYNRFRWYAPEWGRYLTPDPLGVGGGFNRYAYVDGDPIHRTDYYGRGEDPETPPHPPANEPAEPEPTPTPHPDPNYPAVQHAQRQQELANGPLANFDPEVQRVAAMSPTLTDQLNDLHQNGWTIEHGAPGGGCAADRQNQRITVDPNYNHEQQVQALSHEAGHAGYDFDNQQPVVQPTQGMTRDQFVDQNVDRHLYDEGVATMNNNRARDEILQNGGPDIGVAGAGQNDYINTYNDYKAGNLSEQQATHQMGQRVGQEVTSTTGENYRDYYGQGYGNWWDANHPPPPPPGGGGPGAGPPGGGGGGP
jgi:RHS repeat-associated protein